VREISMLPTLKASQELKNWYFTMKFFPQHCLSNNNMYTKFKGQKIYKGRDIKNLPTCVAVRNFSVANFESLPTAQKLVFYHEILQKNNLYVNNMCTEFQDQKIHQKNDIHQHVYLFENFLYCQS